MNQVPRRVDADPACQQAASCDPSLPPAPGLADGVAAVLAGALRPAPR